MVLAAIILLSMPGESAWLPGCIFFKLTGLYCPGCGTTRMLFYLVHGHVFDALRYNALSLLVLPAVFYALVRRSFAAGLPALPHVSRRWMMAFAFTVVLFTVARNIPAEPFCKLAPGGVCRTHAGT